MTGNVLSLYRPLCPTNNWTIRVGFAVRAGIGRSGECAHQSGTNNDHGSVCEFNRLSAYTANTYANDAANAAFRVTIRLQPVTGAVFRNGVDPRGADHFFCCSNSALCSAASFTRKPILG
jgi:hypothetical protein